MKTKKTTATQTSLFNWVNPHPIDRHPLERSFQPEMRFGTTVTAADTVNLILKGIIDPATRDALASGIQSGDIHGEMTRTEIIDGLAAQCTLQDERGWDAVELERWMEAEGLNLSRGFTDAGCYSELEWFVLTGEEKTEENPF